MIYPFQKRFYETKIQYDYVIVLLMMIALIPVLGNIWPEKHSDKFSNIAGKLGRYAFYAYFGQAIFYSFDRIIYSLDINILFKAFFLHASVPLFSFMLYLFSKWIKIWNEAEQK